MYSKIVVPLDGSKLAESVLPHVEVLAQGCATEVITLISVTEHIVGSQHLVGYAQPIGPLPPPQTITSIPVSLGRKQQQAERYLTRIANRLRKKGLKVVTAVGIGRPAEEIVKYAVENGSDLIAMASHGRSGLSRWALGSVADKVLRSSPIPVLIVKIGSGSSE